MLELDADALDELATRKEAVAGLELARGTYRYLPTLVGLRGYRTGEVPVQPRRDRRPSSDEWPHPIDLLSVWWLCRRRRSFATREITVADIHRRPTLQLARTDSPPSQQVKDRAA